MKYSSEIIDQMLDMASVINLYASPKRRYGNRIPCPIHNGEHTNFKYDKHTYYCFTCGAKGNIITFVQDILGLDRKDAISKLDEDFGLGIGEKLSPDKKAKLDAEIRARNEREEAYKRHRKELYQEYIDLCEELSGLHKDIRYIDRLIPCLDDDAVMDVTEYKSWAMGEIDNLNYQIDEKEREIQRWVKK